MIRLSGINKSFPDGEGRLRTILHQFDMTVNEGEFVAIKGASGVGKTTLLNILGTLLKPDAGSYLLQGKEMTTAGLNVAAIRNRSIGFLYQNHRLMPQLTALQNILLPTLAFANSPTIEQEKYALELLSKTGIAALAQQLPSTLSGGEAQRVALCRALIMRPKLLLADEPTGQLDEKSSDKIVHLLRELVQTTQLTTLLVTHADEIAQRADRIVLLTDSSTSR